MFRKIYSRLIPRVFRDQIWVARKLGCRPVARSIVRKVRTALGAKQAWVRMPQGRMLVDLTDEGLGRVVYDLHEYEPDETGFLSDRLHPGMFLVDIGANVGYYTLLASRLVGPTGQVIAFEPEAYNRLLLSRNVARNRLDNVRIMDCALGASSGSATIRCSSTNFGDHRVGTRDPMQGDVAIRIDTFDRMLTDVQSRLPDVVKMDTQGYECHIVKGMKRFFEAGHPALVLTEYWPYGMRQAGGEPSEFLRTFAEHGFVASVFTRDSGLAATPVDLIDAYLPPEGSDPGGCFLNLVFHRK